MHFCSTALLQMLFFNTNNEWGLYVDFIPAYSQYITGEIYAVYDNDYYESLIVSCINLRRNDVHRDGSKKEEGSERETVASCKTHTQVPEIEGVPPLGPLTKRCLSYFSLPIPLFLCS